MMFSCCQRSSSMKSGLLVNYTVRGTTKIIQTINQLVNEACTPYSIPEAISTLSSQQNYKRFCTFLFVVALEREDVMSAYLTGLQGLGINQSTSSPAGVRVTLPQYECLVAHGALLLSLIR